MKNLIQKIDNFLIKDFQKLELTLVKFSIFLVYFYFGFLKFINKSPAEPLIEALFHKTLAKFISFSDFYPFFALFEMLIGILFLIRGLERIAILFLFLHLLMTFLPLLLLPQITWQSFFVPTLQGQYIIKNVLLIALAIVIGSKLRPISK